MSRMHGTVDVPDGTSRTPLPPSTHRSTLAVLHVAVLAVVVGIVTGAGTQILQGELPEPFSFLANSGAPWAAAAFGVGALARSRPAAAVAGAAALAIASPAYYVAAEVFEGVASGSRGSVVWAAAGLAAGTVFGVAGHLARRSATWRWPAVALLAGVLLLEGVGQWIVNPRNRGSAVLEGSLGVALLAVAVRGARRAGAVRRVLVVVATGVVAAAAGYLLVDAAFGTW